MLSGQELPFRLDAGAGLPMGGNLPHHQGQALLVGRQQAPSGTQPPLGNGNCGTQANQLLLGSLLRLRLTLLTYPLFGQSRLRITTSLQRSALGSSNLGKLRKEGSGVAIKLSPALLSPTLLLLQLSLAPRRVIKGTPCRF